MPAVAARLPARRLATIATTSVRPHVSAAVRPSRTPARSFTARAYGAEAPSVGPARVPGRTRRPVLHFRPAIPPPRAGPARRGDVAQPEEHRVRIAGVRGSSPLISTTSTVMVMKILVAHATQARLHRGDRRGDRRDPARGRPRGRRPPRRATSSAWSGYEAVVLGSALYSAHWQRDANRFVKRHLAALQQVPVWLFSSGPLDRSADFDDIPLTEHVEPEVAPIGARGHRTFGGRLLGGNAGRRPRAPRDAPRRRLPQLGPDPRLGPTEIAATLAEARQPGPAGLTRLPAACARG